MLIIAGPAGLMILCEGWREANLFLAGLLCPKENSGGNEVVVVVVEVHALSSMCFRL